jgi:hypothetical protein
MILWFFCEPLATWLEPGERVEADNGYLGLTQSAEREEMGKLVRNHQETVNKRFKQWGILEQVYHNHLIHHRDVFVAICVITQLVIENSEPLFPVHCDIMDVEDMDAEWLELD